MRETAAKRRCGKVSKRLRQSNEQFQGLEASLFANLMAQLKQFHF